MLETFIVLILFIQRHITFTLFPHYAVNDGYHSSFYCLLVWVSNYKRLIILIVRFFVGRSQSPNANNVINTIDPILDGPVGRVYKLFFRKTKVDDQKLVLASIIFYAVVYFALKIGVNALVNFLLSL